MAISDYEQQTAIVLDYKWAWELNEGQIEQISHNNMLIDKVCEEYPRNTYRGQMFHINNYCLKRTMVKFPNAKASIVHFCSL
jgi:hypothetical protein